MWQRPPPGTTNGRTVLTVLVNSTKCEWILRGLYNDVHGLNATCDKTRCVCAISVARPSWVVWFMSITIGRLQSQCNRANATMIRAPPFLQTSSSLSASAYLLRCLRLLRFNLLMRFFFHCEGQANNNRSVPGTP